MVATSQPDSAATEDDAPFFSVIVPVWNPSVDHFRECVDSVMEQTFDDWELLLIADGPQVGPVDRRLDDYERSGDPRIRVLRLAENGGISAASQAGLEAARGGFIAMLDNDDRYAPGALGAFAAEILRNPDIDLGYSDEDRLDAADGHRKEGFYKPAFSMERLRAQNYVCHLLVVRRSVALDVGGFRSAFDGAQDHDLALRVAEQARRVLHIPRLLYHWRESPTSTAMTADAKPWAFEAGTRAVADHLERTGFPATAVANSSYLGVTNLVPQLTSYPKVSIVIPTGGATGIVGGVQTQLVTQAIRSTLSTSTYPNYEFVVVFDAASEAKLMSEVAEALGDHEATLVQNPRSFNFAEACNIGAMRAEGEIFIFLNDDTEAVQPDWIERLVMYATQPEIGAVGAKLFYGDGRVQHAGVWSRPTPGHRYAGFDGNHPGRNAALYLPQNCLAVTGACLAVERSKFDHVGAFPMHLPLCFNDVDLCLKLVHAGYRNVVDCATTLIHHESQSRDPSVQEWEIEQMLERWGPLLMADPYDNPCHRAYGVNEYPATPVDLVERETGRGLIDTTGRVWPNDAGPYVLGRPNAGVSAVR